MLAAKMNHADAAAEFWDFSLEVYDAPGVARMCLELQAAHDADVNLLLCAAWLGATGRGRLDPIDFARLAEAIAPLHDNVVSRLRAARDWLKAAIAEDQQLVPLREAIKAAELESERMVQHRLAKLVGGEPSPVDAGRRLGDAAANVIAYLDHLGVQSEDSQAQAVRVLTAALAGRQNPAWPRC
jgi:uncharacterized protein (TIGR02444 family)